MAIYERLGVLAMVVGTGAICTVGIVYLRPAVPPTAPAVVMQRIEPRPVRDVAWFKAHRPEMRAKFAACTNDPGGLGASDPECPNALAAQQSADIDDVLASMPGGAR